MITIEEVANTNTAPLTLPSMQAHHARGTVLIVEDDRSIRRYLEVILQRAGYCVVVAADGLEAMKAVLTSAVDAVVTDAIMPHLNGYELCRFLRHHPKLSRLPVVLLSGFQRADAAPAWLYRHLARRFYFLRGVRGRRHLGGRRGGGRGSGGCPRRGKSRGP